MYSQGVQPTDMWKVESTALAWLLGAEIPEDVIHLGSGPEGEADVRCVSLSDQQRWRDSRTHRIRGYGALGDQPDTHYPFVPVPEWMLDCCSAACEVHGRSIELPASAIADHTDNMEIQRAAEVEALTHRLTSAVNLLRVASRQRCKSRKT